MAMNDSTLIQFPLPFDDTVTIPLTQSQVTIVDAIDADLISLNWYAHFVPSYSGGGKFVVVRGVYANGKTLIEYMHRVIMSRMVDRPLLRTEFVDHIHGDPLDNRRSKLRLATSSQNLLNRGRPINNTSGYKGVSWSKVKRKWTARFTIKGKTYCVGYFDDIEVAYAAYCKAGKEMQGEFFNPG